MVEAQASQAWGREVLAGLVLLAGLVQGPEADGAHESAPEPPNHLFVGCGLFFSRSAASFAFPRTMTSVACPPCCPICGDQCSDHSGIPHLVHRQDRALLCSCALHQVLIIACKNRRRYELLIPLYFLDYCVMVHCVLHNTPCFYLRVLIQLTPEHV